MTQPRATTLDYEIPALRQLGAGKAMAAIGVLSVAVVAFLFWLIYFKPAAGHTSAVIGALPALNATLNGLSAIFLISGYIAVRRRRYQRHIGFMLAAVASSALFFISYVVYHNFHGDTKFLASGPIRPIYFFVLISHIVLSVVVVPMILTSLYLSFSGRIAAHKRMSRWTLPIWLYVSVTGVLIFVLLKLFNAPPAV
jgi:putative membrane protein